MSEPHAKRKAPPPTLEESRPPKKAPPITPWIPAFARPPFGRPGKPQAPLPPTAVPTSASLRAPPAPPKVTTAIVAWDYTFVREQAPVTPFRAAPLTPPKARALQGAAPVVDQAWADIANDDEYILPATWYARPPTEAAPATPTEMPPLPPDAIDAAPALVVITEDSWPRVRIAPTLGPLVPTERPLVDPNLPCLGSNRVRYKVMMSRTTKSKRTTPTFVYPGTHGSYQRVNVNRSVACFVTNPASPKGETFVLSAWFRIHLSQRDTSSHVPLLSAH